MADEQSWRSAPLAVIDVETTGLDAATDRIIEIAVIHMAAGEVEAGWSSLVNPEQEIPEEVSRITGIGAEEIDGAPRFAEIADKVASLLEGRVFVAYNQAFDRGFVRGELARAGIEWDAERYLDPLTFVRELHRDKGSKRLGAVAARLGVELDEAHRAAADATAAGLVLYALADGLPDRLEDLLVLQQQWEAKQENEMASWRGRKGQRPAAEVSAFSKIERGTALGPAYVYGDDTDPVRAMFAHLPDSGSRR